MNEAVIDYWYEHYSTTGCCGLCGNHGKINTIGLKTPAGKEVGGLHFCICPNGQCLRNAMEGRGV